MKFWGAALFAAGLGAGVVSVTTPVPQDWQFVPEAAAPHYLHVVRDGVDLGRAATGTYYDGSGSIFIADEIKRNGFE